MNMEYTGKTSNTQKRKPKGDIKYNIDLNSEQKDAKRVIMENDITVLKGQAGSGKAQPLDAIIYTPNGPKQMGDIKINDVICGKNGETKVIGIYPQGMEDIYEITCSDKTKTRCSLNHLWEVQNKDSLKAKWVIKTTKDLIEDMGKGIYYRIPHQGEVSFNYRDTEINPYLIGLLLSEGHLRDNSISFTTNDSFILNKINEILEKTDNKLSHITNYDYRIIKKQRDNKKTSICESIINYGLINKISYDKFIPDDYKYNSKEVRLQLLQGLFDGDGYVDKKGGLEYSTSSERLANDVAEVIRSLGGRVFIRKKFPKYTYKGEKLQSQHLSYTLSIVINNPERLVSLPRKKVRLENKLSPITYFNRYIKSIERVGIGETQCIKVDAEDELYVTDNFIVTHNTILACLIALDLYNKREIEKIIICRPAVSKEEIGFLPGGADDKLQPYIQPIHNNFYKLTAKQKVDEMIKEGVIQMIPLAYMRGHTFQDSFILVDETQNLVHAQTELVIGRLGMRSKMVLCGDTSQIDLKTKKDSGLSFLTSLEGKVKGFKVITLKENHRHPIVAEVLNLYKEFND
jgi:hypothetical protein